MEPETKQPQSTGRKQGGRPVKLVKKSNILVVRLTDTERILIAGKAREAGMKASEWFRMAAKKAQVIARLSPADVAILRVLTGLANNLNQIARLAHKEGLLSVQRKCRESLDEINDTLRYFNSDDRKSHDR
ncbi:MAG: plasmid mobilization protein [Adhaeribacter sp.]